MSALVLLPLLLLWAGALIVTYCCVVRNRQVFKYRRRVANKIHTLTINEIEQIRSDLKVGKVNPRHVFPKTFGWRWKEFDTVHYNDMVWRFWKKLPNFYTNTELEEEIYDSSGTLTKKRSKIDLHSVIKVSKAKQKQ